MFFKFYIKSALCYIVFKVSAEFDGHERIMIREILIFAFLKKKTLPSKVFHSGFDCFVS